MTNPNTTEIEHADGTREKFERIVEMQPAFDKRDPDPRKNYGIHGVTLRMILKGAEGAVQFVLYTNWQLPHVMEEQLARGDHLFCEPLPADLGYHSPRPMYEGHEPMGAKRTKFIDNDGRFDEVYPLNTLDKIIESEPTGTFDPCPYLDGKPCYYDGSGLQAERIYNVLLAEGSDGVWRALEEYYRSTFHES
jgi:hypothetical protein